MLVAFYCCIAYVYMLMFQHVAYTHDIPFQLRQPLPCFVVASLFSYQDARASGDFALSFPLCAEWLATTVHRLGVDASGKGGRVGETHELQLVVVLTQLVEPQEVIGVLTDPIQGSDTTVGSGADPGKLALQRLNRYGLLIRSKTGISIPLPVCTRKPMKISRTESPRRCGQNKLRRSATGGDGGGGEERRGREKEFAE
ncbi:zinc finger family protein [Dorcoceras hygrometricum]|uniref:Zinc finger family protein n=1 Tax=Dorcoceras hygrometricum TaxID=472368 RepID=A0A2Z7CS47_9LAMI|nr:zinc finger family protein [Dorcoceras hygrometricum]